MNLYLIRDEPAAHYEVYEGRNSEEALKAYLCTKAYPYDPPSSLIEWAWDQAIEEAEHYDNFADEEEKWDWIDARQLSIETNARRNISVIDVVRDWVNFNSDLVSEASADVESYPDGRAVVGIDDLGICCLFDSVDNAACGSSYAVGVVQLASGRLELLAG